VLVGFSTATALARIGLLGDVKKEPFGRLSELREALVSLWRLE
jgi:hypothetical protein